MTPTICPRNNYYARVSQEEIYQILNLYSDQLKNVKETSMLVGRSPTLVKRVLLNHQILIRKITSRRLILNPTPLELEVIDGCLLGDGGLSSNLNANTRTALIYGSKSSQHVEFVRNKLIRLASPKSAKELVRINRVMDNINRTYYKFATSGLEDLWDRWYPQGIKTIPQDLKLTSLMTLVWYLGDGSLDLAKVVWLATHCFSRENLEETVFPQLSKFQARLVKGSNPVQFGIAIPHRKISEFFDYIGPCPFLEYDYKWNRPPYKIKRGGEHA